MASKRSYLVFLVALSSLLRSQSGGGYTSGASAYCDSLNSGFISLNNYTGNIVKWQMNSNNAGWTDLSNMTSTQSYNNLKKTTRYRAIVKNGVFPEDTSTVCTITVQVKGETGTVSGGGTFCKEASAGTIVLNDYYGSVLHWEKYDASSATWNTIANNQTQVNHPLISESTRYRAIVQTLTVCPLDTTDVINFTIDKETNAGVIHSGDTLCYGSKGDTLKLRAYTGNILDWYYSENNTEWTAVGSQDSLLLYPEVVSGKWYKVKVKSGICPEQTVSTKIDVYEVNQAYAGEDKTIVQYQTVQLKGSGKGSAEWSPSITLKNANSFEPEAQPFTSTDYVIKLTDAHQCVTYDTVSIHVIIPIPTAITPNGDDLNDSFIIDKIEDHPSNKLIVFNRWGGIVYKAEPYKNDWNGKALNGKDLPDDIYYYVLDFGNGTVVTNYLLLKR